MGRRKQANPVRVDPDDSVLATSSTSPSTTSSSASLASLTPPPKLSPFINGTSSTSLEPARKKSKVDFSIKAQLEATPKSSPFNSTLSPQSLTNALKAYETLINELNRKPNGLKPGPLLQLTKEVDKLASRDGKRDPVTESALDLRIKKVSNSLPTITTTKTSNKQAEDDTLGKLSSLVGKAGTSMNASMAAVVKATPLESKDDNDPCKIFTCLQCYERFPGMQELVTHMSKTKHFNQPKITTTSTTAHLDPHVFLRQSLISSQKS